MTSGALAVGLLGGQMVVVSGGAAYAGSGGPTVTFAAPVVSGWSVTLSYSVNRAPQQISGVVCSLTIKGGAVASASCGHQTTSSSSKTSYSVTLSSLNARTYTYGATVRLSDNGSGMGSTSFMIQPMTATCMVKSYNAIYNGAPHTATGTCTGAGGVLLPSSDLNLSGTAHTNPVSNSIDGWTFNDPTGNYNNTSGTVTDTVGRATANCNVASYSVTYDGNAHTATGSCTGVGGVSLPSGDLNLSRTSHTNVASYPTDSWSFSDPNGNYTSASGSVADAIAQATANCKVSDYSATYDGTAHTATGACTGAGGVSLPSSDLNLTNTTHTKAGSYPGDAWSFADSNYTNLGGTVTDTISQATATCTVGSYSVGYDGNAHTATGSCTGVGGVNLGGDLNLTATAHTNAGTYPGDTWSFSDPSGNYTSPGGTVTDTISQATATCTVGSYSVGYDGKAHTATGSCTGVGGVSLPSGDLNLAATAHTSAGSYSGDAWSFADPNYTNLGGTVTDTISQASATCTVGSYSVGYDGNAHTATGSCTGVGGVNLSGDLNLAATVHTNAGTYPGDTWSFSDPSGNYISQGETVDDSIGQAAANCTVTGYNVRFDGNAHTATGSCTDINGFPLPAKDLDLSHTTHTSVGAYPADSWTFTDPNYTNLAGTISDAITAVVASQTLSFTTTAPTGAVVGATPYYTPAATTTATDPNLQVTLTVDPAAISVCSINTDGTVNFNAPGTCTVDANQAGDANFLPAAQVQQNFTISVPLAAIPQVVVDFPDNPQSPVLPPDPAASNCPKQQFPDGGCQINDLDGTVDNTFAATATDPNPDPSHDTVTYSWHLFYPPIFGIPGVDFSDAGISGLGWLPGASPDLQIAAGSLPQLVGDKKAGGDPFWRAMLTVTVNGYTSTTAWFRFIYDSNFPLDFSTNCQLFQQFMGLTCAIVAPQLLPHATIGQAITFKSTAPANGVVGGAPYTPIASGGESGSPVILGIDSTSTTVCSIGSNGSVSFNGAGTCTIDANQAGLQGNNFTFTPAPQVQQSFNVGPAT